MKHWSRTEKICLIAMAAIAGLIVALLLWAGQPEKTQTASSESVSALAEAASGESEALSMPEDRLPQKLTIGALPPTTEFTDANGSAVSLESLRGKPVLLLFWGSWCKYCKDQLALADSMRAVAEENGATVLLVDKLDPEKETREAALALLEQRNLGWDTWFDENLTAYKAWGLQLIPTSVVLRADGTVGAYATGVLTEGEYRGLFEYALEGGDAATAAYVKKYLLNSEGGVQCSQKDSAATPGGHDVLSESQGMMMLYAAATEDRALFDRLWSYTRDKMEQDGLAVWYVTDAGEKGTANATLDDLRILQALMQANAQWGGYANEVQTVRDALYTRCTQQEKLVSFCDMPEGGKAQSLSLCYADLVLLRRLAQEDARFAAVAENAAALVQGGYISDAFPLYYAAYSYETEEYVQDDLNTAEALYTLWNLARADALPAQSLAWLKRQVEGEGLAARYHADGTVVDGYDYHSTAVYALAVLIGKESGDADLVRAALQKMERYRNTDAQSDAYGRFGETDDAAAFDQCMPLLAYVWAGA